MLVHRGERAPSDGMAWPDAEGPDRQGISNMAKADRASIHQDRGEGPCGRIAATGRAIAVWGRRADGGEAAAGGSR
jgi:hypothetical protein